LKGPQKFQQPAFLAAAAILRLPRILRSSLRFGEIFLFGCARQTAHGLSIGHRMGGRIGRHVGRCRSVRSVGLARKPSGVSLQVTVANSGIGCRGNEAAFGR